MFRMCLLWQRKKKLIDEALIKNIKGKIIVEEGVEKLNFAQKEEQLENEAQLVDGENEDFDYKAQEPCIEEYAPQDIVLDERDFDIPDEPLPKCELGDLSKRKLWGELSLKLREMGYMTLHSACVEVKDLSLADGVLTVGVKDDFTLKFLTEKENFDKISLALKQIDDRISIKIVLKKTSRSKTSQNLQILKNLFGEDLVVG